MADYICVAAIWFLLVVRCLRGGHGLMWSDEILAYDLIHTDSASHMLSALGKGVDGAPPVYYLAGRVWTAIFSGDPVSLRMFSTIGFCVGFSFLWATLRQAIFFFVTLVALTVLMGQNLEIAFESLNIRFYGLLFALFGAAVFLGVKLCVARPASRSLLVVNAVAGTRGVDASAGSIFQRGDLFRSGLL